MIEVETRKPIWAAGVMTGTSMDGLDVATVLTNGLSISSLWNHFKPVEFSTEDRLVVQKAVTQARKSLDEPDGLYVDMHSRESGEVFWDYFEDLYGVLDNSLAAVGFGTLPLEAIGVHGQTVAHAPDEGLTLQIFCPNRLMEIQEAPVVWDFRSEDVRAGGQGAPLAPFYHFALAKHIGATEPVVFLNIGGVANITWVDPRKEFPEEPGALMAFDTGPGNALVNDWMFEKTKVLVMDVDGGAASTGRVHRDRLQTNWGKDYLRRPGPKSLDRNDFHGVLAALEGLSINDGAATLTQFTVDCVVESVRHMPSPPTRWLVCGGGRHNQTMMQMLQDRLDAPVEPVEAVGLDGDMLEAQAFAYLAVRVLRGLPTSAPSTTGCRELVCGGRISYPT
ncbi:MAG: anhydro-N-acetylmuramic acid kinase [Pseudomonadota bacterium]